MGRGGNPGGPRGIRSFVALWPADEVRRRLVSVQQGLGARVDGIRWVRPGNLYLTVRFLGGVSPQRLEAVRHHVREVFAGEDPFVLDVAGLGTFPGPRWARGIWCGVRGETKRLCDRIRKFEEGLRTEGIPPEPRPFHPHIPLGRGLRTPVRLPSTDPFGPFPWRCDRVVLVERRLGPDGPRYREIDGVPLGREER